MGEENKIIIVEDDPFAKNWATLLVARDWRTRAMADFERPDMHSIFLANNHQQQVDVVVPDTETPLGGNWVHDALKTVTDIENAGYSMDICSYART